MSSRLGEKSARSGVSPWLEFCVCDVSLGFSAGVLVGCDGGDPLGCWLWSASLVLDLVLDEIEALSLPPGLAHFSTLNRFIVGHLANMGIVTKPT